MRGRGGTGRPCPAPESGYGRRARTRRSKSIAGSGVGLKATADLSRVRVRACCRSILKAGSCAYGKGNGAAIGGSSPLSYGEGKMSAPAFRPREHRRRRWDRGERQPRCAACRPSGPDPRRALPGHRRRCHRRLGMIATRRYLAYGSSGRKPFDVGTNPSYGLYWSSSRHR